MTLELPEKLTRYLHDAEIKLVSWLGDSGELILEVAKEIGPEIGRMRFTGVAHVQISPWVTVLRLTQSQHTDGDWLFTFEEAWGESYSVIAESVSYEVKQTPGIK